MLVKCRICITYTSFHVTNSHSANSLLLIEPEVSLLCWLDSVHIFKIYNFKTILILPSPVFLATDSSAAHVRPSNQEQLQQFSGNPKVSTVAIIFRKHPSVLMQYYVWKLKLRSLEKRTELKQFYLLSMCHFQIAKCMMYYNGWEVNLKATGFLKQLWYCHFLLLTFTWTYLLWGQSL